jgi:2Fe-2S ferredoxin
MPLIRFIEADGRDTEVDADAGYSVMQAAVDNMVDGILAECGGSCSCATCHCYIDPKFTDKIPEPTAIEKDMLSTVSEPKENSRLSCQVIITDEMEGMEVHLPASQF